MASVTPSGRNDDITKDTTKVGYAPRKTLELGWKGVAPETTIGLIGMMHDGD